MDRTLDRWVQLVTGVAVLALAAALIAVGFNYYGHGDHASSSPPTEVR